MDKNNHNQPAGSQTDSPADRSPEAAEAVLPPGVELDSWVLTPAQRTFIQSLLSDDDESDSDR